MKKYGLAALGMSLHVIVTIVDVFVVSLPMPIYVFAVVLGAALIMIAFLGRISKRVHRAHDGFRPAVYHIRRYPMIQRS